MLRSKDIRDCVRSDWLRCSNAVTSDDKQADIEVKGRPSLKLSEPIGLVDVGGDVRPCAV